MSCTPTLDQTAYRLRNDDGNETTATWVYNENNSGAVTGYRNYRIRFVVQVTNACAAANRIFQLQFSLESGSWTPVNASSNVVRSSASPNLADAANLTDQMTTGSGTMIGTTGFDEVDGAAGGNSLDIVASGHAQVEYCFQFRPGDVTKDGDNSIKLRLSDSQGNLNAWTQTPDFTLTVVRRTFTDNAANLADGSLTVFGDHQVVYVDPFVATADAATVDKQDVGGGDITVPFPADPWATELDSAILFLTYAASLSDTWATEADSVAAFLTYALNLSDQWQTLADALNYDKQDVGTTPKTQEFTDVLATQNDNLTAFLTFSKVFTDTWANEADNLSGFLTFARNFTDQWQNLVDALNTDLKAPDIQKAFTDAWGNLADSPITLLGDHLVQFTDALANFVDALNYVTDSPARTFSGTDNLNNWSEGQYQLFGDYLLTDSDALAFWQDALNYERQGLTPDIQKTFTDTWQNLSDNFTAFLTQSRNFTDGGTNLLDNLSVLENKLIQFTDSWAVLADQLKGFLAYRLEEEFEEDLSLPWADSVKGQYALLVQALDSGQNLLDVLNAFRSESNINIPLSDDMMYFADLVTASGYEQAYYRKIISILEVDRVMDVRG